MISIVIPIFCEQENLAELYRRLTAVFDDLENDCEIIFVDDCSTDNSLAMMREMAKDDSRVKVIRFARNFGHQLAITAGMKHSSGEAVIVMDGDLQDPPEVLPGLIERLAEDNLDIVYGIRKKRKEPPLIRALYWFYYKLLRRLSYIDIPTDAGDFCIMSRRVVDEINAMPERSRFVRGLRSWVGFRQTGLEYERAARAGGQTKYTFRSLLKLAFDGIFSFSFVPLRLSTYLGLTLSLAGLLYALFVAVRSFLGEFEGLAGWPTVVVSILILGGVQLIMLGIMGEYLGRIYEELKGRPLYIIHEKIGFDESPRS